MKFFAFVFFFLNSGVLFASDDPFESANRKVHGFNEFADQRVLKPAARFYENVFPRFARVGVTNFFSNLSNVNGGINSALQWKPGESFQEFARLCINTTFGIGGLFDPASRLGIPDGEEDFGQTLAVWGLPEGAYIVIPFFGPSTIKNGMGSAFDLMLDPMRLYRPFGHQVAFSSVDILNNRAELLAVEGVVFGDKYLFYKNAYLQRREYLELDGEIEDAFDDEF